MLVITRRELAPIDESLKAWSPLLQRIYASRGITHAALLDKRLQALLPFDQLMGIDAAATRLSQAIRAQQRVLVVGDFDADGATSSALAVSAMRAMGALNVSFLVPNRFEFGYGLTPGIVNMACAWRPDLIVTVDNGISSVDGVNAANEAGIDVLVTDHHLPADELPNACAIVNPNQVGDAFLSKSIAGVGVIFYVMLALRHQLRESHWFVEAGIAEPNMAQFLDLVALGTVADVVALDQNNRILVNQGLARIRQGLCRPGIKALLEVAGRDGVGLRESDLGFSVAPRLNAAGRLDDMSLGIDCLLEETPEKALVLARELDDLNKERRRIEADMKEQAIQALDRVILPVGDAGATLPVVLCLTHDSWHQGVIGILAGRLKERYHRPVIAFAQISEEEWKGSARSVPSLNIRDVLASVDKDHPGMITKFGGHAMAAGLSMHPRVFPEFKQALLLEVEKQLDVDTCRGEIVSDGPLSADELTLDMALQLQNAGPWGQLFPEPLFDNRFEILDQRLVGQHHLKLALKHEAGGEVIDAIAFNINPAEWPNHRARFLHAAYKLDVNTYRNRRTLQLMIIGMQAQL
jgi:single-stranded-DNA-specific exonuclease